MDNSQDHPEYPDVVTISRHNFQVLMAAYRACPRPIPGLGGLVDITDGCDDAFAKEMEGRQYGEEETLINMLASLAWSSHPRGISYVEDLMPKVYAAIRTAPPSAPVGPMADDARVPDDYRNQASGYRAGWNDALACRPSAPVGVEAICEQLVQDWRARDRMPLMAWDFRGFAADAIRRALAQQPAAVDGAVMRRLEGLARRWDESANSDKNDSRRAAKRKCASDLRALTAALAAQPQGDKT